MKHLSPQIKQKLLKFQENEITEHHIYNRLAKRARGHNKKLFRHIAKDELRHYGIWKKYTGQKVTPNKFRIIFYYLLSIIFGLTFGVKLMERGEQKAQDTYDKMASYIPTAKKIMKDEDKHETYLINMIKESALDYIGSIVLGLNDALVELTGALAGFTFALQNTQLIALVGLITGIAASFSMGTSEYLSIKTEGGKNPLRAAIYTGIAYIITVLLLIIPFFLLQNPYIALVTTLIIGIIIILLFTFYTSVAKGFPFKRRFLEMVFLSLGVATVSFLFGILIRTFFGIEI